jgi:preprotein translocase subunit SecG
MDKQTGILLTIIILAALYLAYMGKKEQKGLSLFNINL